jgi:hypothetical protein
MGSRGSRFNPHRADQGNNLGRSSCLPAKLVPGPFTAPSGQGRQGHQQESRTIRMRPPSAGEGWRLGSTAAARTTAALGNRGAQVRNRALVSRRCSRSGMCRAECVAKLPACCACCPPTASLVGWGASAHAPPRQLQFEMVCRRRKSLRECGNKVESSHDPGAATGCSARQPCCLEMAAVGACPALRLVIIERRYRTGL